VIDPSSAIIGGAGAGAVFGFLRFLVSIKAQGTIDKLKEDHRHAEANSSEAQSYRKGLVDDSKLDKGEPYKREFKIPWLFSWKSSGTRPDRLVSPPYNRELRLFVYSYCWAIFVCFLCADVVIFSKDISGDPDKWIFLFGVIERVSPDRTVYIQSLGGIGAALLVTASFITTNVMVGFSGKSK
jgi:hypothetical protein